MMIFWGFIPQIFVERCWKVHPEARDNVGQMVKLPIETGAQDLVSRLAQHHPQPIHHAWSDHEGWDPSIEEAYLSSSTAPQLRVLLHL
jgi:hypothetical protein